MTELTVNYDDGSNEALVSKNTTPPSDLPPVVLFPGTKVIDASENGKWARIRHDGDGNQYEAPRIEGGNNNEINVKRTLKADLSGVDPRTKITVTIGASPLVRFFYTLRTGLLNTDEPLAIQWENYCKLFSTNWAWQRIIAKGYWCFDRGYPKMDLLGCGGNDVHVLGITSDSWARVEYQDYDLGPNYSINPYHHRWLFSKQWLVGGYIGNPHWVVDKGYVGGVGDVNLPLVSNKSVYTSTWFPPNESRPGQQGLEFWPDLPLKGKFKGYDTEVTITKYGLWKTNTYGWVDAREQSGWRMIEEMIISGDPNDYAIGGTWEDRRVYFDPWLKTHPPTYIGWTRES